MTFTTEVQAAKAARVAAEATARAEDIRWMVDTDENLTGVAKRLGITPDAVAKWCKEHDMRGELDVLRSREIDVFVSARARAGAAARWAS